MFQIRPWFLKSAVAAVLFTHVNGVKLGPDTSKLDDCDWTCQICAHLWKSEPPEFKAFWSHEAIGGFDTGKLKKVGFACSGLGTTRLTWTHKWWTKSQIQLSQENNTLVDWIGTYTVYLIYWGLWQHMITHSRETLFKKLVKWDGIGVFLMAQ